MEKRSWRLGLDLYSVLPGEGNLFYSPYSLNAALARVMLGACTTTRIEMEEVLYYQKWGMYDIVNSLAETERSLSLVSEVKLLTANRVFLQQGYPLHIEFSVPMEILAGLEQVSIMADPEKVRKEINQWVENKTERMIPHLLPSGALDIWTRLVVVNAIYFKGLWSERFDNKATKEGDFYLSPDRPVKTMMMRQTASFPYVRTDTAQVFRLPYQGKDENDSRLSMTVVLPLAGISLEDAFAQLSEEGMPRVFLNQKLNLVLPRFEIEWGGEMSGALMALGMRKAFDELEADFTGITLAEQLFIKAVYHKAKVILNEEGTEAAAATAAVVQYLSVSLPEIPVYVIADHPFLFTIDDRITGEVLFMGRLVDPTFG